MVKTVVAVIVGLVLLNTAWFVLKIAILIVAERREYEKYRYKSPYQSPHREAFIMECSDPNSSPCWKRKTYTALYVRHGQTVKNFFSRKHPEHPARFL